MKLLRTSYVYEEILKGIIIFITIKSIYHGK